jgi:predicted SnoaL-like aldol condensation-catalyzing enzyme
MNTENKSIVTGFIEEIWNQNHLERMDSFLHADFTDHSLPPSLPPDKEGLTLWVNATGKSFEHQTIIEEMVCEDNKVMIKIKMLLKHVGTWRELEPAGAEIATIGYRYFRLVEGRIIEHWALIDGNTIENQIKETQHGCKVQH